MESSLVATISATLQLWQVMILDVPARALLLVTRRILISHHLRPMADMSGLKPAPALLTTPWRHFSECHCNAIKCPGMPLSSGIVYSQARGSCQIQAFLLLKANGTDKLTLAYRPS
jgi:hypothetical protein